MKNFNIFGVHKKIQLLDVGSRKTNIEERLPKKEGVWTICQFDGGLCKKVGGDVFEGGRLIPQYTPLEHYQLTLYWSRGPYGPHQIFCFLFKFTSSAVKLESVSQNINNYGSLLLG